MSKGRPTAVAGKFVSTTFAILDSIASDCGAGTFSPDFSLSCALRMIFLDFSCLVASRKPPKALTLKNAASRHIQPPDYGAFVWPPTVELLEYARSKQQSFALTTMVNELYEKPDLIEFVGQLAGKLGERDTNTFEKLDDVSASFGDERLFGASTGVNKTHADTQRAKARNRSRELHREARAVSQSPLVRGGEHASATGGFDFAK